VFDSTVLYPCDAVNAERLTELATATPGIVYIRTTRPKTPVIYPNDETLDSYKIPISKARMYVLHGTGQVSYCRRNDSLSHGRTTMEALTARPRAM
jgi:transketolase C-terminal domain/subunit